MLLGQSLPRRLRRSSTFCRAILLLALVFLIDTVVLLARRPPVISAHNPHPARSVAPPSPSYRTVFIAALHTDTAPLLHHSWSDSLVSLVDRLGHDNVHISLVEAGSHDATRLELRQLTNRLDRLGVPNTVHLGPTGWQLADQTRDKPAVGEHRPGWVWHHNDTKADMRRIPHLAWGRNQAMEPLMALAAKGKLFNRVLWIDDVVFKAQDAIDVLNTRNGEYAAACSIDAGDAVRLQDTSALRDDKGQPPVSSFWPWFLSPTVLSAVKSGLPIRVYSCWNGLVAFQSAPFYADPPLRFRSVSDDLAHRRVEASERCLIHADNPLSASQGVWLNSHVRVAPGKTPRTAHFADRAHRYPGFAGTLVGSWVNRVVRWRGGVQAVFDAEALVRSRFQDWFAETHTVNSEESKVGLPCLIDDMQIVGLDGWTHI
jgi:hypothetical protein